VLVIGIDGLRWERTHAAPAPWLTGLARAGELSVTLVETGPAETLSGPGWSSLATGVWPDRHSVCDNTFVGARYDEYPDFLTLAKRANSRLSTFAAVDWPPLAWQGTFGKEIDVVLVDDGEEHGYQATDARVAAAAEHVLRSAHPDAAFVYLGCVDVAGHLFGPLSDPYREALVAVDRWVGDLVDAVQARPSYPDEDWLVLIATDHGHRDEGGHGGLSEAERQTFVLGVSLSGRWTIRPGARLVDIAPTVLAHLGVTPPPYYAGVSLLTVP
jgi:predicted AlkP superfamily pyrophosphatase or phosphodiesterase